MIRVRPFPKATCSYSRRIPWTRPRLKFWKRRRTTQSSSITRLSMAPRPRLYGELAVMNYVNWFWRNKMGSIQPNIPSGTPGGSLPGARPSTNGMAHRQSPSTISDNVMSPGHSVMSPGGMHQRVPGRVPTPHDGRITPGRVPTPSGRAPTPGDTASPAMGGGDPRRTPQAPSPATSGAPCPSPGAMSMDEKMKSGQKGNQRPPSNGPHMTQVKRQTTDKWLTYWLTWLVDVTPPPHLVLNVECQNT